MIRLGSGGGRSRCCRGVAASQGSALVPAGCVVNAPRDERSCILCAPLVKSLSQPSACFCSAFLGWSLPCPSATAPPEARSEEDLSDLEGRLLHRPPCTFWLVWALSWLLCCVLSIAQSYGAAGGAQVLLRPCRTSGSCQAAPLLLRVMSLCSVTPSCPHVRKAALV